MSSVKIKKAKIKDELFLEVEYTEDMPGHTKKDTKLSCTIPVHNDLKNSFKKLHTHLAILCDEVKEPKKNQFDTSEFDGFTVKGFSIGGSDDNEGVTISGFKEGKYGTVNLNTPFKKWSDDEYPFISELSLYMTDAIEEVEQYLFNGKRAPEAQLELQFEEEENDNHENYVTNA